MQTPPYSGYFISLNFPSCPPSKKNILWYHKEMPQTRARETRVPKFNEVLEIKSVLLKDHLFPNMLFWVVIFMYVLDAATNGNNI